MYRRQSSTVKIDLVGAPTKGVDFFGVGVNHDDVETGLPGQLEGEPAAAGIGGKEPAPWIVSGHVAAQPLPLQIPLHVGEHLINFQGKSTWFSVYKFLLTHASGAKFVGGIAVDVTERRSYERQMIADEQLLRKLIELQEKELFMVSHDIHDGFVQEVFGAKMLCEALATQLNLPADSPSHPQFQTIIKALSRAIAEARRLISELRPLVIDEEGIAEAIRYLISDSAIAQEIKITFTQKIRTPRYDPMLEGNLFRIVQEALNNARRHSEAAAVSIHLEEQGNTIRLTIQDNGIGFDLTQIDPSRFGIRGIRERARLFGGTAKISSQPGTGTQIIVEVPREPKPKPDH